MLAYIKRKRDFRTLLCAEAVSWNVPLASIEDDVGTITLHGTAVNRGCEGDFLIMDGHIWIIEQVAPEDRQTTVTVGDIHGAFDRPIPFTQEGDTIGAWLASQLRTHYRSVADPDYAMPYIQIVNTDVTAFLGPTVTDGLFNLKSYMRKINRLRDVQTEFSVERDTLVIRIFKRTRPAHSIVFDDGRCQLISRAYSRSSIAKVTAYRNGIGTDYYMAADGSISTTMPRIRASGAWQVLALSEGENMDERVRDVFSQNANSHRIEWRSDREFNLYDTTWIRLDGGLMSSYVSYIGISSSDNRYHYKSGELATTLTEHLRKGVSL